MLSHGHNLGDDRALSPLHSKDFCQFPQISGGRLSDGEDGVTEPSHAKVTELLIKKLDAQLTRKKGDIFDYGKTDAPLLILCQLDNGGEKRLGQKLDPDNYYKSQG